MAQELKVRIQLKTKTAEEWSTSNEILLKGELGIELSSQDGTYNKIKMGDGVHTWNELLYTYNLNDIIKNIEKSIDKSTQIFEVTINKDEDPLEALNTRVSESGLTPVKGNYGIVKEPIINNGPDYRILIYIFNGTTWTNLTENYNANSIYFDEDLTITTDFGVQKINKNGNKLINTAGKNIQDIFKLFTSEEKNPEVTIPSAILNILIPKEYEVGTRVTPNYSIDFNSGSYSYTDETGVTVESCSIIDSNDNTSSSLNGELPSFLVEDDTMYKITATINYSDGVIPKTNLGNPYTSGQIKGSNLVIESEPVLGYRSWFTYVGTEIPIELNSDWVRSNCTNKQNSSFDNFSLEIPDGCKNIFFAIPSSLNKQLKAIWDVEGLNLNIKNVFSKKIIKIAGNSEYNPIDYDIWQYINTNGISATTYTINIS